MSSFIFAQQTLVDLDNWASKQTDSLNTNDIINYINGNRTVTSDIAFGTNYTYSPSGVNPNYIDVVALSETLFVIAYSDYSGSEFGKAVVGMVTGNQISFGSTIIFNAELTHHCSLAALTSSTFVVAFYDHGDGTMYGTALVGTVSGSNITFGSEQIFHTGLYIDFVSIAGLDDNDFILTYSSLHEEFAKVGRVSGDAISFGNNSPFNDGNNGGYCHVAKLDESDFVVIYSDNNNSRYGTARIGTRSGTSISSWGSKAVFVSADMTWGYYSVSALEANKFVVAYQDLNSSKYGKVRVGAVGSGNTITYGTESIFNNGWTDYMGITSLDQNNIVISYRDQPNFRKGTLVAGTISGNTVTTGIEYVFNNNNISQNIPLTLNSGKFAVVHKEYNGSYSQGVSIIGELTNNQSQDLIIDTTLCENDVLNLTATTNYTQVATFDKDEDNWINCNSVAPEIAGTNRSVFMWMYKDTQVPSGDAQMLLGLNTSSGGAISNFYVRDTEKLTIHDGNNIQSTNKVVTDGVWHFVGYTYNEATNETKIYVDGALEKTFTNGQSIASNSQVSLGQEFDNSSKSNFYDGKITEVSFWNEVLTTFDIQDIMNSAISNLHPKYSNLKAYYSMIPNRDSSYMFIEDATINGNNGIASVINIQSVNIEQVIGFDAAPHYSKIWKKDDSPIGTGDEISIMGTDANAGSYQLLLISDLSTITDDWTVAIASLPQITFQPSDTISTIGESAYFETSITGGSYDYQWGEVIQEFGNKTTEDGLGQNFCFGLHLSENGVLYVATNGGVSISNDGGSGSFANHPPTGCQDVYELNGVLYVATGSQLGISTDGGNSFTLKTTVDGLGSNNCTAICSDTSLLYVATGGGLSISSDGGESFYNKTESDGLGDNRCNDVYIKDGIIYVATNGGLSTSTDGGNSFINKTTTNGLGNNRCNGVYQLDGNIYVSTYGGLSISNDGGNSFNNKTTEDGLGHNNCSAVYKSDGTLYVTTYGGLAISTDGGISFVNKTTQSGLGDNRCNDVYEFGGKIYVATMGGCSISPLWDQMNGEISAAMNLSPVLGVMDSSYYSAKVTSSVTGCSVNSDTVQLILFNSWNGLVDNDWDNQGNWATYNIPELQDTIFIRDVTNKPVIGDVESASCNQLIFYDNATLTIESSAAGTGSLIIDGSITNNSPITAKRYTTAGSWHGISSPLNGNTANSYYLNGTPEVWLKEHSESTNAYTFLTSLSTPLSNMKGFFIWIDGTEAKTFEYDGELVVDEVGTTNNLIRSATGSENGWNFVGNPFTSAIDWNAASGWTKTNIDNTIYQYNSASSTWTTWNGTTGTNGGTQYIASGQGFFVSVSDGSSNGTLKMDNDVQVHNSTPFLKQTSTLNNFMRLELSSGDYADETVIYLNEAASVGYDSDFDAYKLFSFNPDVPQIYSSTGDFMAANSLPLSTTHIAVDVRGADNMDMTISLSENSDFGAIFLTDNYSGTQTNLLDGAYNFKYISDFSDRFTVSFTATDIESNNAEFYKVYAFSNEINVIVPEKLNVEIFVYNLSGQTIVRTKGYQGANKIYMDKTGQYIVKVVDNSSVTTKKVFIK